jgi:hypothetical protein
MPEEICISPNCMKNLTSTEITIEGPYPKILTFHLNYTDANGLYPDNLLKLFATFPESVKLSELFNVADQQDGQSDYELKGFIGFLGAHYVAFFRTLKSDLEYDELLISQ